MNVYFAILVLVKQKKSLTMEKKLTEEIFGTHAAKAVIENPSRKIDSIICTKEFFDSNSILLKKKSK